MSRPQSSLARPSAGAPERRQLLVIFTWLLTCCAVLASAAWGNAIDVVARALVPYQSANDPTFSETVVNEAALHMWIIVIVSFLVIVALAVIAILLGRKALRMRASDMSLARLEKWAVGSLVGGLVLGLGPTQLLTGRGRVLYLSLDMTILFPSIVMAGAVGSFILSGIAVRHATAEPQQAVAWRTVWRTAARICLVVASLIMLGGFVALSLYAHLIVGFFNSGW